ncbi:hypothetical protein EMCRGX_G016104 [Ephydatia muelleri]
MLAHHCLATVLMLQTHLRGQFKVKGQTSSAVKVVKTKKHEAESYSQPRTLLQRQDKRPDEPSSKPMQPVKQVEQQKNSTDTQKHSGNDEFSNMVREMEFHSKSKMQSTPTGPIRASTPSSSTPTPSTPTSSKSTTTKHQVLRYSQQSISKQEQYPQGPRLIPPYFMYGPARQSLLPTPQPYRPGPQPPIRGPPPMDYGYQPPPFPPYHPGPPPPHPSQFEDGGDGWKKYIGTPAPTKPEAQQMAITRLTGQTWSPPCYHGIPRPSYTSRTRLQDVRRKQQGGYMSWSIGILLLRNNEGGGVVGSQAAPQDPLLSLLTDLDDDVIGYQEAVPSTDGADGEVVVVGEIIGQDALHLSGAQDVTLETEGMATGTQEVKQVVSSWTEEVVGSDKLAEEVITKTQVPTGSSFQ